MWKSVICVFVCYSHAAVSVLSLGTIQEKQMLNKEMFKKYIVCDFSCLL